MVRTSTAVSAIAICVALLLPTALAAAKFSAPKDWHIPDTLGGIQLYKALVDGGATAGITNSSYYTDDLLMSALGRTWDARMPTINIEGMLAKVIWQQHPQQAIDTAFSIFERPVTNGSSTGTPGGSTLVADPATPTTSMPDPFNAIAAAHPSLRDAVVFLMDAPQAMNVSFLHINDLSHRKVWLLVAQIKAIARGRGACVPPPGTDMGGWEPQAASSSTADSASPQEAEADGTRKLKQSNSATQATTSTGTTDTQAPGTETNVAETLEADTASVCSFVEEIQFLRWLVGMTPQRFALPLLRRMTVAALLQRRSVMQEPFTMLEQRQIVLLFLQFYVTHRTAAMRKAVVEFFHISKAGGTSMCSLSQKNGCTTWDAGEKRNCLVYEFDDLPHWVSRRSHVALATNKTHPGGAWFMNFEQDRNQVFCGRRRQFMQMKGWDMYAHEYTLVGGRLHPRGVQLCTEMLTMLQVRHPYTRLVSHLRWVYGLYHERIPTPEIHWPNTSAAHWKFMAPPVVDNYYTRSLLGEATYRLPAGRISKAHGALAQLLVAQYDVLLVLEQSNSRRLGLGLGLGWKDIEQTEKHRSADELMAKVLAKQNESLPGQDPPQDGTSIQAVSSGSAGNDAASPSKASKLSSRKLLSDVDTSQHGADSGRHHGDKTQSLIRAATSEGVPKDLGVLLAMNDVDLHLYQFASWLARFDAAVLETVKIALGDDAYAGLPSQGSAEKLQARIEARERKLASERHQAKMIAAAIARGEPPPIKPHTAHISRFVLPVDDASTCGFAGY